MMMRRDPNLPAWWQCRCLRPRPRNGCQTMRWAKRVARQRTRLGLLQERNEPCRGVAFAPAWIEEEA